MNQFTLQPHIDQLYADTPQRLAFDAHTRAEFEAWQQALRQKIRELLRIENRAPVPVSISEPLHEIDRGQYVEEKRALDVGEGVVAPLYLLRPKTAGPWKPVLVFHGHNPSVQFVLGNYPDEETGREMRGKDNNYAQALAEAGYFVCAVEQRGFGERMSDHDYGSNLPSSCRHLAFSELLNRRNLLGERCWDGICAINYLETRDDLVPNTLGCTGNSGGGTTALWLSVIDERISVVVPSCYFCSFEASIGTISHCECNYVPGILEWADMGDLAASLAPRPFRAIAGKNDPIFPVEAVREQFETVQRAYTLLGVEERASLTVHEGAHAYNHQMSQAWFAAWL